MRPARSWSRRQLALLVVLVGSVPLLASVQALAGDQPRATTAAHPAGFPGFLCRELGLR